MILLEALCLGIPIVARRTGGVPEVICDGLNGILVDSDQPRALAEACSRLLDDVQLRARLGASGPASVREKFTAEQNAAGVVKLYRSLLEKKQAV